MGKYMKKGKITGDVAVMEISQSTSLGVRTRARTLALQPNPELSYLQLRSRRLEKPPFPSATPKPQGPTNSDPRRPGSRVRVGSVHSGCTGSVSLSRSEKGEGHFGQFTTAKVVGRCEEGETEEFHDLGLEASFGENNLEFDGRDSRGTRENTPCSSLIRDSETIGTPGSTTRSTCSASANRRARNMQSSIPTTPEMEDFFAGFEMHQQKLFMEKYNYDVVNDSPLPGRYEWVRVDN